ncbi:MAG: hypothetical protein M3040_11670 [Bacteroidota bacterium]|nr:hypothetical protein [Bacteroidota bacterium]
MIKKWFARTSPFLLLSIIIAFLFVYQLLFERGGSNEWAHPWLLKLLFLFFLSIILDLILKHYISKNVWLWTIELLLCLGFIYYWIIS